MKPNWYRMVVAGMAVLMFPFLGSAQAAPEVGVVTTLQGEATVARVASTAPLPLKFRDSIFEKDRINTGEKSIVKVLMGGRAIVTVRELSVLTITEEVGRTVVNLESGKIAVGVAKQRMKPGETLEVHTPNAVAAVRGTVFVVEVTRQGAQVGGGNLRREYAGDHRPGYGAGGCYRRQPGQYRPRERLPVRRSARYQSHLCSEHDPAADEPAGGHVRRQQAIRGKPGGVGRNE